MEQKYLIDTNILIYYFAGKLPEMKETKIDNIFKSNFNISIITKIEFLGWKKHTEAGYLKAKQFINNANCIFLTEEIASKTIELRKQFSVKLPDAVIAATSLLENAVLLTNNTEDFSKITPLIIENPFE